MAGIPHCGLAVPGSNNWKGFARQAKPYGMPRNLPLPRKNLSSLDPRELRLLLTALERWAALGPTDVRGPCVSMQVHAFYCNKGVHDTWGFLPWHRAFVYFHERTLGMLAGCPDTFRLPAWDWENAQKLPPEFMRSKLFNAANQYRTLPVNPAWVTKANLTLWLNSSGFEDFVGGANLQSNAWKHPHDSIHLGFSNAMAEPSCAAGEKIFYLHHVNVDRYWKYWWDFYVPRVFSPPAAYLSQSWSLYDENGHEVLVKASDFVDPADLGYSYTPPSLDLSVMKPIAPLLLSSLATSHSIVFPAVPPGAYTIDPAPLDVVLDLNLPAIDLHHVNEVVFTAGGNSAVVGYVSQFGDMLDPKNVPVRVGIGKQQLQAAEHGGTFGVRQGSSGVPNPNLITPVQANSVQFYALASSP
jgi:polyphenol oxidase